jgi:hypothetical protein
LHFHRQRLVLRQTLRRQHVLDFARADAKRERAETRRECSCDYRRKRSSCRLRQTKLWSNDVNDALFGRVNVEELNAKLLAVCASVST